MSLLKKGDSTIIFWILLFILIILETLSALLSYETIGEVTANLYFLIIFLNVIPILLFLYKRKFLAILICILIALIYVPEQIQLTNKLIKLKEEGANIVNYIYNYKIKNNEFPEDISEYVYKYTDLKKHFSYTYKANKDDFSVYFYVGSKSTSHFYIHSKGYYWDYYPD